MPLDKAIATGKEKILVRGVNWLGDAVMTTPALIRLREARPLAHISLLAPEKLAGLWQDQPMLDQVLTFAPDEGPYRVSRQLRQHAFDTMLILPNSPRSTLEGYLAGIPRRVGYARPWRNFFLTEAVAARAGEVRMHKRSMAEIRKLVRAHRPGLTTRAALASPSSHHLHQYLDLAAVLGASPAPVEPRIVVSQDRVESVRSRFGLNRDSGQRPLVGINAGAEYGQAKRWPADRFVSAALQLQKILRCDIWVFGGAADAELGESIAASLKHSGEDAIGTVAMLAGKTSLQELCAALKACDVMLTNDTGPMHVAAAVGTPVVVPFGSTSPTLTGPGLPGAGHHQFLTSNVPCSPCFLRECPIDFRCMQNISVAAVVEAAVNRVRRG
jgi:heptosyltransferase II